jgi:hypothetical protein
MAPGEKLANLRLDPKKLANLRLDPRNWPLSGIPGTDKFPEVCAAITDIFSHLSARFSMSS